MFTKEIVEELSEFLSIEFKCPNYPVKLSCIFNENNRRRPVCSCFKTKELLLQAVQKAVEECE